MKKASPILSAVTCLACAVLLAAPASAVDVVGSADTDDFGLGLSAGEPARITSKIWFDEVHALDIALGFGYYPYSGPALYVDYLHHAADLASGSAGSLLFYLGIGGKFRYWNRGLGKDDVAGPSVGARVPFGLTFLFRGAPFDLFLEVTPSVAFISPRAVWFDLDAALGGRFYF